MYYTFPTSISQVPIVHNVMGQTFITYIRYVSGKLPKKIFSVKQNHAVRAFANLIGCWLQSIVVVGSDKQS